MKSQFESRPTSRTRRVSECFLLCTLLKRSPDPVVPETRSICQSLRAERNSRSIIPLRSFGSKEKEQSQFDGIEFEDDADDENEDEDDYEDGVSR